MAKAVVREAVNRNLVHEELHSKVEYIVAHGISSKIGEKHIVIGSYHFVFEDENATIPEGKKEIFEQLPEQYSHLYMAIILHTQPSGLPHGIRLWPERCRSFLPISRVELMIPSMYGIPHSLRRQPRMLKRQAYLHSDFLPGVFLP